MAKRRLTVSISVSEDALLFTEKKVDYIYFTRLNKRAINVMAY